MNPVPLELPFHIIMPALHLAQPQLHIPLVKNAMPLAPAKPPTSIIRFVKKLALARLSIHSTMNVLHPVLLKPFTHITTSAILTALL